MCNERLAGTQSSGYYLKGVPFLTKEQKGRIKKVFSWVSSLSGAGI